MWNNWSQWISLSDMMTWLMLVFLLISILVISEIQEKEENKNKILIEYSNVKDEIYKDLKKSFEDKEKELEMTISNDLSIKFTNPDVLFADNNKNNPYWFKSILNDFIPQYISIINNSKYNWKIKEIRVEWHAGKCLSSEYMYCLTLSQWRSNSVLQYIFSNNTYKNLNIDDKDKLKFLFTSNGMSDWKNLDTNGEYIYYSNNDLDAKVSRRVEFRIVSNSEDLVNDLLNNLK